MVVASCQPSGQFLNGGPLPQVSAKGPGLLQVVEVFAFEILFEGVLAGQWSTTSTTRRESGRGQPDGTPATAFSGDQLELPLYKSRTTRGCRIRARGCCRPAPAGSRCRSAFAAARGSARWRRWGPGPGTPGRAGPLGVGHGLVAEQRTRSAARRRRGRESWGFHHTHHRGLPWLITRPVRTRTNEDRVGPGLKPVNGWRQDLVPQTVSRETGILGWTGGSGSHCRGATVGQTASDEWREGGTRSQAGSFDSRAEPSSRARRPRGKDESRSHLTRGHPATLLLCHSEGTRSSASRG